MPSVKVNLDNRAQGSNVVIPNLGSFSNGSTTEIPERALNRFLRSSPNAKNLVKGDLVEITTASLRGGKPDNVEVKEVPPQEPVDEYDDDEDEPTIVEKES